MCIPVVTSSANASTLRGVACIDVTMDEVTNEFENLQRSDHTYIFIIDTSGRTILHPMLPIPDQDRRTDRFLVDIEFFEPRAAEVLASMKRYVYFDLVLKESLEYRTTVHICPLAGTRGTST